jgi:uncharacterized membrane protein YdjX (TVP38/TMEM64 family)
LVSFIETLIENGSYYGIFALVFGINVIPFLMPPSWMVLASIYAAFPAFNPLYLALIGATASTLGRFVLMLLSSKTRNLMGEKRKRSLDAIAKYLEGKKYAYFIISLIFAIGPLPSNMLFIGYGIIKARTAGIFLGFWIGRSISYFVLISISSVAFKPLIDVFSNHLIGIIVLDMAGVASVVAFAMVDWEMLIIKRKIVFMKPRFRN